MCSSSDKGPSRALFQEKGREKKGKKSEGSKREKSRGRRPVEQHIRKKEKEEDLCTQLSNASVPRRNAESSGVVKKKTVGGAFFLK